MTIKIINAREAHDVAAVKQLFLEYADWIPVDLGFQGFAEEMDSFPNKYVLLLLAKQQDKPIGAVGLTEHDISTCEMKRLFVSPNTHSKGVGTALCDRLLKEAKNLGYETMLLDTLSRLKPAVALYEKLGFTKIAPYNVNPEPDVTYMSRLL